ncbi:hypothetical protein [Streptacidiphilus carbonis]|jgi:hypothetical protein|uniref:hypothetical protein n=1 Tax=Streptacidiphilus carbonis TaxID=105422 RepID=UPI001F463205|nr:hypothetical protein [Streptacidiphilus carbonis]
MNGWTGTAVPQEHAERDMAVHPTGIPHAMFERSLGVWRALADDGTLITGTNGTPLGFRCLDAAQAAARDHNRVRTSATPELPSVGSYVVDIRSGRIAVLRDLIEGTLYLRPGNGGREWEAMPSHVRLATPRESLMHKVQDLNAESRRRTD